IMCSVSCASASSFFFFFFFSSRRRHTRFSRDWSSDVCSSDLVAAASAESRAESWEVPTRVDEVLDEAQRRGSDPLERERLVAALDACAGNQRRAAELLGISRRTLVNRLNKWKLPRPRKKEPPPSDTL